MIHRALLPKYVEVETSRLCNRSCQWCPNGHDDSRKQQELMCWNLFEKIAGELQSVTYDGWIALHNYNEPLANPRLQDELSWIQRVVPRAKTSIFTNGDLLTDERLNVLIGCGVAYVRVTLYPTASRISLPPSQPRLEAWLRAKHLSEDGRWTFSIVRQGLSAVAMYGKTHVEVISPDLRTYNWRGGTVLHLQAPRRSEPCFMTQHSLSIDYKGRLKMCCNVYPDRSDHEHYVIGDAFHEPIFDLWNSARLEALRKAHAEADWTSSPICSGCSQMLPQSQIDALNPSGLGEKVS